MSTQPGGDGRIHPGGNGDARYQGPARPHSPYSSAAPDAYEDASTGQLLKQLMREASALATNEIALAKSEAREAMEQTREGAMAVSAGGLVAFSGFVILLLAAVYGLSTVMAPWAAALLVGAVVTALGAVMVSAGKRKFSAEALRPEHTMNSLHKDREVIRRRNHEHH